MNTNPKSATRAAKRALKKQSLAHGKLFFNSKNSFMKKNKNAALTAAQEKQIRVGLTVCISDPRVGSRRLDFSADLDRFRTIFNHVNRIKAPKQVVTEKYHGFVMDLFKNDEPTGELFFTYCMHYAVTRESVAMVVESNPHEGVGFQIAISSNDSDASMVLATDYDTWYNLLERARADFNKN
ncbi:MAG: hypothetical protein RL108_1312 [Bacteroidota bacterium]|jgi:hypothetical protein